MERISKLLELLQSHEGDSFLQHALALEYIKTGDESEARKLFEKVLENDAMYTGTYYHLALLYIRTGERKMALQTFEKGMEVCKLKGDKHALCTPV
ncbi:MAG: tetratricopeptide repeat protein [Proteobacteria bacterium]|nr:MAG: tetratricopeptide repeat protein [Pseudomonadota bacterium]